MKDETTGAFIKGLKKKIYLFFVDVNSENKMQKVRIKMLLKE